VDTEYEDVSDSYLQFDDGLQETSYKVLTFFYFLFVGPWCCQLWTTIILRASQGCSKRPEEPGKDGERGDKGSLFPAIEW